MDNDILAEGRAIAEKYNQQGKGFDNTGKKNAYECEACGAYIVTVDCHPGVTPFMTRCGLCHGIAQSKMYRAADWLEPTHEWYRPDTLEGIPEQAHDHLSNGGLILRAIDGATWRKDAPSIYPKDMPAVQREMQRLERQIAAEKPDHLTRQMLRHAKRKSREAPAEIQMYGRTYTLKGE